MSFLARFISQGMEALSSLGQELIFPRRCYSCGAEIEEGLFCLACREGLKVERFLPAREELSGIYFLFGYEQAVQDVIREIKFLGNKTLPEQLGEETEAVWSGAGLPGCLAGSSVAVGVPTDPERRKQRGFDLPEKMLRKPLETRKIAWEPLLVRTRHTVPMFALTPEERRLNLEDCFAAQGDVCGKNIILVDDIFTTGATMEAAALVLKKAGAGKITGLAFCGSLKL